ncbi:MAG: integrase [Variovorax paradoxus]|nr:MAG: integrase [Variovorax paradoxus]PZQ15177.1 MAG: integrase [Variovorax paradoxus]
MTDHSARRQTASVSPGRIPGTEAPRRQDWAGRSPQDILARLRPGKAEPLQVLEMLLTLFNTQHTAREKTVSHKTRHERARFLRQFFHDLQREAGFHTMPDPRNLGQKHLQAMVLVWQRERLAPATIQTYLSFLRGLASWLNKPGFVRRPAHYGLSLPEYQRHETAQRDKSWTAQGIDVDAVLAQVAAFDPRVAASMRLMHTLALRRKESVMFRPHEHVVPFERTGLPAERRTADTYVWIKGKGGRVRWVAIETAAQQATVDLARSLASSRDAHMGHPAHSLQRNLRRLDYALAKFGITRSALGVTGHGLRHGNLNDLYEEGSGQPSPVRGGGTVPREVDREARLAVAARAGHSRIRAAGAYVGARPMSAPKPTTT